MSDARLDEEAVRVGQDVAIAEGCSAGIRAALAFADRKPPRCFHCGATFSTNEEALLHFGISETSPTACQIDIVAFRDMEEQLARYQVEDSNLERALYRMRSDHEVALRREEEKGYERGLKDGRSEPRPITDAMVRAAYQELIDRGRKLFPEDARAALEAAEKVHNG